MNRRLNMILIIGGIILIAAVILTTGIFVVRAMAGSGGPGSSGWFGFGMLRRNNASGPALTPVPGTNAGGYYGRGMMGGYNGGGMMGGYWQGGSSSATPLTVDQANQAVDTYLNGLNNPDLALKEIMVFQNNAYARVTEKSTGIGAMELLVNPATLAVFPEYGPDMMWNLKYSPMYNSATATGYMGGMMNSMVGGYSPNAQGNPPSVSAAMPVTPEQAVKAAQQFIDQRFPGSQADPEPDAFYGYYTIDILKNGQPVGMLSVNGFNQQIFYHTWHGSYITGSEF